MLAFRPYPSHRPCGDNLEALQGFVWATRAGKEYLDGLTAKMNIVYMPRRLQA